MLLSHLGSYPSDKVVAVIVSAVAGLMLTAAIAVDAAKAQEIPGAAAPAAAAPAAAAPAAGVSPEATAEADTIWQTRCFTCHGMGGKGDGPAGVALTPKPRDLTLPDWQKGVTDEHIEKIIREGGQAVGLSILMPANPDLAGKPEVIQALRAKVRSLSGQ